MALLSESATAFYAESAWYKVEILAIGAMLVTGKQTMNAVLWMIGAIQERNYALYHQMLLRAVWSGLAVSVILLSVILKTFDAVGVLFVGLDETIEGRRGKKIKAKGSYPDGVWPSKEHLVKASALLWVIAFIVCLAGV
jgi:hypothetical protein